MRLTKQAISRLIHHSNAIEGLSTPYDVVLKVQKDGVDEATTPLISNHLQAIEWIKKNKKSIPSLATVCSLHRMLLKNIDSRAGVIRHHAVCIGSPLQPQHVPPNPASVHYHLDNWLQLWGKKPTKRMGMKRVAFLRHCEFEWIHPFSDGNGRVGRLLLLWDCLHHKCEMDIIESSDKEKHGYYDNLQAWHNSLRDQYIGEWR